MFFVPSESMEPLLVKDDRILVQKMSYWKGDVQRGDVIVFRDPGGWLGPQPPLNPLQKALSTVGLYPTGGHLVKRVIGVGGDEVRLLRQRGPRHGQRRAARRDLLRQKGSCRRTASST